jgi:hypothetical protein
MDSKGKRIYCGLPEERSIATEAVIQKENNEVESTMNYQIIESQGKRYLYLTSSGSNSAGARCA